MNSLGYRLNEFVSDNLEEIQNNFGTIPTMENVDDGSYEYEYASQYASQFYFAGVANVLQRIKELAQE